MTSDSNYNLDQVSEEYEAFVENDLSSEPLNAAGALVAEQNLGEEEISDIAELIEDKVSYEGQQLEDKIEGRAAKAKVYNRVKDKFEHDLEAASMIHSKSLDGRDNLADMQLENEYEIEPSEAHSGHSNWRIATDFELDENRNYILGLGNTAHKIHRYTESETDLERKQVAEAVNNHVDRETIHHGGAQYSVETQILEDLQEDIGESMMDLMDDFTEWFKEGR